MRWSRIRVAGAAAGVLALALAFWLGRTSGADGQQPQRSELEPVALPDDQLAKLRVSKAVIYDYGFMRLTIYNGSDWKLAGTDLVVRFVMRTKDGTNPRDYRFRGRHRLPTDPLTVSDYATRSGIETGHDNARASLDHEGWPCECTERAGVTFQWTILSAVGWSRD